MESEDNWNREGRNQDCRDLYSLLCQLSIDCVYLPCVTAYGRLEYIYITQVGMVHADMAYIINSFAEIMPAEAILKDLGKSGMV